MGRWEMFFNFQNRWLKRILDNASRAESEFPHGRAEVSGCLWAFAVCLALNLTIVTLPGKAASYQLPAGKTVEIRLTHSLASYSSRKGTTVEGVVIAPVFEGGQIVIPMYTKVIGTVLASTRVGWGLLHETAHLTFAFNKLTFPDGTAMTFDTQVTQIDNARESVNQRGRVNGIRSTGTVGYRANGAIAGLVMIDPIAYIYVNVAAARMLRFSEPEIWFPAGTELAVKLVSPLQLSKAYELPVSPINAEPAQRTELQRLIRLLPYRTETVNSKKSDLTNLVFLGNAGALKRAFEAAGWLQADRLNTITGFLTLRSIAENQRYQSAPMSLLLLDEQRPYLEFSKSLNTFSKRHHARIWLRSETWDGMPVLTASSTQDIGIQLSRKNKTFIHVIDTNIDNERTKIINDLIFTGCVDQAELLPRPWIAPGASNATGETLLTDRRVAILKLNECRQPRDPVNLQAPPDQDATGHSFQRGFRQGFLVTRNDIFRGNLVYQGYEGTKLGIKYLKQRKQPSPGDHPTASTDGEVIALGADESGWQPDLPADRRPLSDTGPARAVPESIPYVSPEEKAPLIEIGARGGWLRFGSTLDVTNIGVRSSVPDVPSFTLLLQNRLSNGWAVGTSVTLNSWRYFSNEFSYDYQRGHYRLGAAFSGFNDQPGFSYQEQTTGLLTNQFGYAFLVHLSSRERRFRPYIAVGLAFQLLHITDAPLKSSGGIFKVGLRNVGLILSSYNFANTPPLDGGGVFQFGFQYGGGVKYRLSRRWLACLDFRETLSAQPNFIGRSIDINAPPDASGFTIDSEINKPAGPLREQRISGGFSFIF